MEFEEEIKMVDHQDMMKHLIKGLLDEGIFISEEEAHISVSLIMNYMVQVGVFHPFKEYEDKVVN